MSPDVLSNEGITDSKGINDLWPGDQLLYLEEIIRPLQSTIQAQSSEDEA